MTFFSIAAGSLVRILQDNMFSALYIRDHTYATYKKIIQVMNKWPKTGNNGKNEIWVSRKIDQWQKHIKACGNYYNVAVFAAIASRCLSDIKSQVHDPAKLLLISKIEDDIKRIEDFTDPSGEKWDVLEKTDELMTGLYKIVDWHLSSNFKMKRIDPSIPTTEKSKAVFKPSLLQERIFNSVSTGRANNIYTIMGKLMYEKEK
jgi:hypothetical protein